MTWFDLVWFGLIWTGVPENGRLPDASQGAAHLRDVFYRMGYVAV